MKIVLNELDDFLDEVREVTDEGDAPVVRYLVDHSTDNEDGYAVHLFASFVCEEIAICELELFCGKDLRMPSLPHRDVGSLKAKESIEIIKGFCKDIGVKVRPGRYENG
jgi:hypothetical protein